MRFTENIDRNVSPDFLPRRHFAPFKQVFPFYLVGLLLVIGTLELQDWFGSPVSSLIAFTLLSVASAFMFYRLQESNDLVMANDFQHLLFASAASLGSSFCFFVRHDGTVVYANDGTRKMFPNFSQNQATALDQLLDEARVSKEDTSKLYSSIALGKKESLVFTMRKSDGTRQEFIVIIDPLKRPSGYFVIHGRPFRSERDATVKLPGILGSTSLDKVEALLDELPIGVYLTNETGVIEYANPALEELTRYSAHQLVTDGLTIQQLIYHADGVETGEFELSEFTGNVLLSCLNKSLAQAFLEQKRIALNNNRPGGYLGIVTPIG